MSKGGGSGSSTTVAPHEGKSADLRGLLIIMHFVNLSFYCMTRRLSARWPPLPPYNAGFLQHFRMVFWPPGMATAWSPRSGSLIIILSSTKCPARSPRLSPRRRGSPRYFVFTKCVLIRSPRKSAAVACARARKML